MMQRKAGRIADIEVFHPCKVYWLDKLIARIPAFLCILNVGAQNACPPSVCAHPNFIAGRHFAVL